MMRLTCKLVIIALVLFDSVISNANRAVPHRPFYDQKTFLEQTDPKSYSSWICPHYENESPISVNVSIQLVHFSIVNEQKSQFTMLINIDLDWIDPRLIFPSVDHRINRSEILPLELNKWHLSRIWRPPIHFSNANLPGTNILSDQGNELAMGMLSADGKVRIVKRTALDSECKLDLTLFPLDIQQCSIQIESTSLADQTVSLNWQEPNSLKLPKDFSWGSFDLLEYALHNNHLIKKGANSSQLEAIFQLRRQPNYLWLELYLPSTLFVISSWTAFWVDIPAAPARVALVLTPMLTHVTSTKAFHDKLPRVGYIHSLDIWVIMCTLFIFAAVVEYATVNYYFHKPSRTKEAKQKSTNNDTLSSVSAEDPATTPNQSKSEIMAKFTKKTYVNVRKSMNKTLSLVLPSYDASKISPKRMALNIDRASRIYFPLIFFGFNLVYWSILVCMSHQEMFTAS